MASLTMTQIKQQFFVSIKDDKFRQLFKNKQGIAYGKQGDVFKATFQGKQVAIKTLKANQIAQLQGKYIYAQIISLNKCNPHPNVLQLMHCFRVLNTYTKQQKFSLIFQYYQQVLQDNSTIKQLSILDKFSLVQQLTNALQFIHLQSIMHRDLKPDNILLKKENGQYKLVIADFGCSKFIGDEQQYLQHTNIGTPIYSDPNVIKGEYSQKCDVYSVGLIIFYIFCGQNPFSHCQSRKQLSILKAKYLTETNVETQRFLQKFPNLQQIKDFLLTIASRTLKQDYIRCNSQQLHHFILQCIKLYKEKLQKQQKSVLMEQQHKQIKNIIFQDLQIHQVKDISIHYQELNASPIYDQDSILQLPLNTISSQEKEFRLIQQENYSNIKSEQLDQSNMDVMDFNFSLKSHSMVTSSTLKKNQSQSEGTSPMKQSLNISQIKLIKKKMHSTLIESQKSIYSNKSSMDVDMLRIKNKLQLIKNTQGILNKQDKLCASILNYENHISNKFEELEIQRKTLIIYKNNQINFNKVKIIQQISDSKLKLEDKKCIVFLCHYLYRHTMQVTRIFLFSGKCIDRSPLQDVPFKKLSQDLKGSIISLMDQQTIRIYQVLYQLTKDIISIRSLISSKLSNQIVEMLHFTQNNLVQGTWAMPYNQYTIKTQVSHFVSERVRVMMKEEDRQKLLNLLEAIYDIN